MSETSDASKAQNCPYCGQRHERTVCRLIRSIEYNENGTTKRVEFFPSEWGYGAGGPALMPALKKID